MRNATTLHPLALEGVKSGRITFVHVDGKEHTFTSVVNRLSGQRMSYFDSNAPTVDDSNEVRWVRSVFHNIRAKARVLSSVGDF